VGAARAAKEVIKGKGLYILIYDQHSRMLRKADFRASFGEIVDLETSLALGIVFPQICLNQNKKSETRSKNRGSTINARLGLSAVSVQRISITRAPSSGEKRTSSISSSN
jgi:hypothetical protein